MNGGTVKQMMKWWNDEQGTVNENDEMMKWWTHTVNENDEMMKWWTHTVKQMMKWWTLQIRIDVITSVEWILFYL